MLHQGSVGQIQSTECDFFLFVSYQKICVFVIFISFSDEVSNFRNTILTNLKPELMINVLNQREWYDNKL